MGSIEMEAQVVEEVAHIKEDIAGGDEGQGRDKLPHEARIAATSPRRQGFAGSV